MARPFRIEQKNGGTANPKEIIQTEILESAYIEFVRPHHSNEDGGSDLFVPIDTIRSECTANPLS